MLAAAVYRLSAKNTARIPLFHGRLLHAAFFSLLQGLSPELSAYIHDTQRQKAFAISPLSGIQPPKTKMQNHRPPTSLTVHKGDMVFWRISAWNDLLTQSLQGIRPGTPIRIGSLDLVIENCMLSPEEHQEAGCLSEEDLIAGCLSVPSVREITFSFRSPVSFRCFDRDFPWPSSPPSPASAASQGTDWGRRGQDILDSLQTVIEHTLYQFHIHAWRLYLLIICMIDAVSFIAEPFE